MNRKNYEKTTSFFKNNKIANAVLKFIYKVLPLAIFIAYPLLLIRVWSSGIEMFLKALLVPAGVFALVTVLRVIINEQRPYEKYGISPVFVKDTRGKSMPSRHTASAFIISMTILSINTVAGIVYLVMSCLITASRVLAGVHYIRDVVVGMIISVAIGIVFLFLI